MYFVLKYLKNFEATNNQRKVTNQYKLIVCFVNIYYTLIRPQTNNGSRWYVKIFLS